MAFFRILALVLFIVTIYVVNVESQSNGEQQTKISKTKDIANANSGNPEAKALTGALSDPTNNLVVSKPRRRLQPRRRKAKRRQRKRRPPPRKRQKNGRVNGNNGQIIAPGGSSKTEKIKTEQIVIRSGTAPVKEVLKVSAVASVIEKQPATVVEIRSSAAVKTQPASVVETQPAAAIETQPSTVIETQPAAVVEKTAASAFADSGFGQDLFFWGETTTVAVNINEPPPDFSVIKIPRKKVLPKVDINNSKAYDGTPCNVTFKDHATDKTKYMMKYAEGVWETLDCPPNLGSGLIWRQDLCACGEELVARDPDDLCGQMGFGPHLKERHLYLRKDHGVNAVKSCPPTLVWSQEKCLCMYDPTAKKRPIENQVTFACKTILQMGFEGNLKNTAEGYQIRPVNLRRRGKLPRIRYRKVPDECVAVGQNRARNASIRLAFQPNTKDFQLLFRTEKVDVAHIIKGGIPDTHGWYKVVVYFEDSTLNMEVNGQKVFQQTKVLGKIPQNKCPLYIAGRGSGYDRSEDFYGYLDNVTLVKDCRFHEANIKFL